MPCVWWTTGCVCASPVSGPRSPPSGLCARTRGRSGRPGFPFGGAPCTSTRWPPRSASQPSPHVLASTCGVRVSGDSPASDQEVASHWGLDLRSPGQWPGSSFSSLTGWLFKAPPPVRSRPALSLRFRSLLGVDACQARPCRGPLPSRAPSLAAQCLCVQDGGGVPFVAAVTCAFAVAAKDSLPSLGLRGLCPAFPREVS